jgi:hypothetical protein
VVLALNALIGFVQERHAERSVRGLMQRACPAGVRPRYGDSYEVGPAAPVFGFSVGVFFLTF